MGAWNLPEFKATCVNSGLDKLWFYTESLAFKYAAAKYHTKIIQQKINEAVPVLSLDKLLASDFEIAFELDALMAALNSIWDILAQLLNECFIKIHTSEISFSEFSDPKKDFYKSIPPEIQSILDSIRGNHLYATIKDYVNVSKHIYAIKGEIEVDFRETPTRVSYKTREFEHKKGQRRRLTPDKAFKCLEFAGKSVAQIGVKIHETVKLGNITQSTPNSSTSTSLWHPITFTPRLL